MKTKIIKYEKYIRNKDGRIFYVGYFNNGFKPVLASKNKRILKYMDAVSEFETRFKRV